MKIILVLTILFLGSLSLSLVIANNVTVNETIIDNEGVLGNITINETKEEPICEEQLELCIDEYNSILEDFRAGLHCGAIVPILKDLNKGLGKERDDCQEEIGRLKTYKLGFYALFVILVITSIVIIYKSFKSK